MGKKIMNTVLFLVVLGGCVAMTLLTGNGSSGTMIYNFAFLAVMAVIYLAGLVVYLIISLCIYARRYDYASRGMKVYMAKLKRLDKRYEGNSRPGTRTKGGRTQ